MIYLYFVGFFELKSIFIFIRGLFVGIVFMKYGNFCVLFSLVAVVKGDISGILWVVVKLFSFIVIVLEVLLISFVYN